MRRKRLARRAALCYTVGVIRAAHRAVRDIAVYRTYCRTEKKGRHIRAAKRQIEPRSARLPKARFQNHIPARGRKQLSRRYYSDCCCEDFKTTSPQGDGNCSLVVLPFKPISQHFKTTSPQGDGNHKNSIHPRLMNSKFQNHIPARGRKHVFDHLVSYILFKRFQNHIPARGRKHGFPEAGSA